MRRQNLYAHSRALFKIFRGFICIAYDTVKKRRKILGFIKAFQICRSVCHNRISRRVRLVKGILCKINHIIINFVCGFLRHTPLLRAFHKYRALFFHNVPFLFAHSLAHGIRSCQTVSAQNAHNLHNLFLIHYASVRNVQNISQQGMFIFYFIRMLFIFYIARNLIHRSRSVKRNPGYNIFKILRFKPFHKRLHAAAFKLENTFRFTAAYHFINLGAVVAYLFDIKINAARTDKPNRVFYDCQVSQAEKIHFQKPESFDCPHRELSCYHIIVFL